MHRDGQTATGTIIFVAFCFVIAGGSIALSIRAELVVVIVMLAVTVASLLTIALMPPDEARESGEESVTDGGCTGADSNVVLRAACQPSVLESIVENPGVRMAGALQSSTMLQPDCGAAVGNEQREQQSESNGASAQQRASTSRAYDTPGISETDIKRAGPVKVWGAFATHLVATDIRPPTPKIWKRIVGVNYFDLRSQPSLCSCDKDQGSVAVDVSLPGATRTKTVEPSRATAQQFITWHFNSPTPNVSDTIIDMHDLDLGTLSSSDYSESHEAESVHVECVDNDVQLQDEVTVPAERSPSPAKQPAAEQSSSWHFGCNLDDGGVELSPRPNLFLHDA